jgi:two-component system, NarL family, response regulator
LRETEVSLRSLLLVDDNPTFLRVLARFLEDQGEDDLHVLGSVVGGRDALAQAERLKPDVILLDLEMPDVSGLDLLPQLRKTLPDAILVALTLMGADSFGQAALAAGADAFVSKASLEHDLVPVIRRLAPLEHRRGPGHC